MPRRSIGVGGHISETDFDKRPALNDYQAGMLREIKEDVSVNSSHTDQLVGFINDDSNAVGQVHLGIVHVFSLAQPVIAPLESEMQDTSFWPTSRIRQHIDEFESWSQICIKALYSDQANPA